MRDPGDYDDEASSQLKDVAQDVASDNPGRDDFKVVILTGSGMDFDNFFSMDRPEDTVLH